MTLLVRFNVIDCLSDLSKFLSCNKGYRFFNACTVFVKRSLHCGEGFYEVNIKFGAQRVFTVSGSWRIFLTQIPISAAGNSIKFDNKRSKDTPDNLG